jgi:hypothetical protein
VIREDRLVISHRPYAADLGSLTVQRHERTRPATPDDIFYWSAQVAAVWFRKRRGVLVACAGTLWGYQDEEPASAVEFLERSNDGRYGGDTVARWDGEGFWGNVSLADQQRHLAVLQPMLGAFPEVPPGYDGWWVYP